MATRNLRNRDRNVVDRSAREAGDVYVGNPAHVDTLVAELHALGAKRPSEVAAGAVVVDAGALVDPCFARQVLPRATLVERANANDLAGAIVDAASSAAGAAGVFGVDVRDVAIALPEMPRRGSRALEEHPLTAAQQELARVVEAKIVGRRAKLSENAPAPDAGHGRTSVSVLLVDTWRAWVSTYKHVDAPALLAWPSPFPGGRALDENARDAPSSAHRKLDEALLWLEHRPGAGDVVVDLGAAPGGWTWVALQAGAHVYAVDRADLDAHIAAHPNVTHVRKDAFKWVPERMPTWLLCDVIAEPQRSLDVVRHALTSKQLRALVVTLKLKNPVDLKVLEAARALCKRTAGFFGRTKNLAANKLEVTVMMRRSSP